LPLFFARAAARAAANMSGKLALPHSTLDNLHV
jgi:hypothetical protein